MSAVGADPTVDMHAALARLRRFLTQAGDDRRWPRGAVGAWRADGAPLYGYPEIAGYWLRWAAPRADLADATGAAVVAWLRRVHEHHCHWPTRVAARANLVVAHRGGHFLFDHAMLWDGLCRWAQVRKDQAATKLARVLATRLDGFVVAGAPVVGHGPLPPRWSGRDGPFLLKAGVRVRGHEGTLGAVTTAALPRWAAAAHAAPHREAHAQLYAIEGLIELGEAAAARTALTALIAAHGGQRGVRESLDGGPRRSDVLAQLLRAACLLGVARPDDPAWAALATELAGRVDAEGRLPFASAGDDCPTWAALFTEQALSLWLGATLPTSVLV